MTNFVYDNTALPTGKVDARPLTGPANQSLTSAEWNQLMQDIADLRTSILTGKYHGFVSDPAAAVSGATGVRIRNNAGIFQVSENAAAYRSFSGHGELHARDFGAVGDGVTDDTAALQAWGIAGESGKLLLLEAGKTYKVTETIRLGAGTASYVYMDGRGATLQRSNSPYLDWAPATVYSIGDRRIRAETVYECTTGGTSSAANLGPKGQTTILGETAWTINTIYTLGQRRYNGNYLYEVTTGGTSAPSGGPTGTTNSIVDGTVTWKFAGISDNTPWIGQEGYTIGQQRSNGPNLYVVTTEGTSASSGGPTGTGTGIVDGTVVWDYVSAITSTVVWRSLTDAIIEVNNNCATVKNLHIGCGRAASYGVWIESGTQSLFENVDVYQALFDGFKFFSNSDFVILLNCQAKISGRVWHTAGYGGSATAQLRTLVTGTFAKTSGTNAVLTYTPSGGAPIADLRTIGLRVGDFISLHATVPGNSSAEWLQINSVDSATQITCTQHPVASAPGVGGLQFSVHRGDGFHIGPGRAENNCHSLLTCRSDNSAGAGFRLGGLYGPRCHNLLINAANSHPIVVATNGLPSIGTSIYGMYTEVGLNGASDNIFCGGAAGITIDTVNGSGQPIISSDGFNWGTITNMQDAGDPGRIDPIDIASTKSYIPSMVIGDLAFQKGKVYGRSYAQATVAGYTYVDLDDRDYDGAARILSGTEAGGGRSFVANCIEFDTEIAVANGVAEGAWAPTTVYAVGARKTNGGNVYEVTARTGTFLSAGAGGPTGTGSGIIDNELTWKYIETGTGIAADIINKSLIRFRNNGIAKSGIGLEGEPRLASQTDAATPGNATNHLPSGSFAMAAGATTVVITNNCIIGDTAWAALTVYAVGEKRSNNGNIYKVTTGGTSAGAGGPTGTGTGIADGTVVWDYVTATSKVFLSKANNDATAIDFKVTYGLRSFTVTANAAATAKIHFDFFVINPVNSATA